MRRSVLALTLSLALSILGTQAALAASHSGQTLDINGNAQFQSILGGNVWGTATLSGPVGDELGTLKGTLNFPLRDEALTVSPSSTILVTDEQQPVSWNKYTCDPFTGCTVTWGTSTFGFQRVQGPVDLRIGSMRGAGNLVAQTVPTCLADCPPPGAYYYPGYGYSQINGSMTSSKEAGFLNINGPAPVIH